MVSAMMTYYAWFCNTFRIYHSVIAFFVTVPLLQIVATVNIVIKENVMIIRALIHLEFSIFHVFPIHLINP